jgi:subtilisin inhibitor-like
VGGSGSSRSAVLGAVLLLAAAVLAACGPAGSGQAPVSPGGTAEPRTDEPAAPDELEVRLDRGDGSPVELYRLTCTEPVSGEHPDAAAACAHLGGLDDPFAPIPDDVACTEQYGGPQTAHVTGRWRGRPVDLALSRVDGCRIAQWDSLGPLLPGPVGVLPE